MENLEGINIHEENGQYSLNYFNYHNETLAYFDERELQGGGYTWEGLVRAGLELQNSTHLADIEFDAEGDMLFLYSSSKKAIDAVESIVKQLSVDMSYREKCIEKAKAGGYIE